MIVLDASVLIAFFRTEDAHHHQALAVLDTNQELVVNALTLAEVLVRPVSVGKLDLVLTALRELEITEVPLPPDAAVGLAQLRARTSLKLPDCCVLLTAEHYQGQLATFDAHLAQVAQSRAVGVFGSS